MLFCSRIQSRILHCIQIHYLSIVFSPVFWCSLVLSLMIITVKLFCRHSLNWGFVWRFLMLRLRLYVIRKGTEEAVQPSQTIIWEVLLIITLITWLKCGLPGFSTETYCFPSVVTKYLGILWDCILFLLQCLLSHSLADLASYLWELLSWCFNCDFLFSSFWATTFINWNSSVRKNAFYPFH